MPDESHVRARAETLADELLKLDAVTRRCPPNHMRLHPAIEAVVQRNFPRRWATIRAAALGAKEDGTAFLDHMSGALVVAREGWISIVMRDDGLREAAMACSLDVLAAVRGRLPPIPMPPLTLPVLPPAPLVAFLDDLRARGVVDAVRPRHDRKGCHACRGDALWWCALCETHLPVRYFTKPGAEEGLPDYYEQRRAYCDACDELHMRMREMSNVAGVHPAQAQNFVTVIVTCLRQRDRALREAYGMPPETPLQAKFSPPPPPMQIDPAVEAALTDLMAVAAKAGRADVAWIALSLHADYRRTTGRPVVTPPRGQ